MNIPMVLMGGFHAYARGRENPYASFVYHTAVDLTDQIMNGQAYDKSLPRLLAVFEANAARPDLEPGEHEAWSVCIEDVKLMLALIQA